MNKKLIVILALVIAFVLLILAAVKGYEYLSENYFEQKSSTYKDRDDDDDEDEDEDEEEEITAPEETVYIDPEKATASFTVYNEDGEKVELSDFFGKPIVVNFWATWCGPCTSEMPHFEEMYEEYGEDIHFLMVNVGDGFDAAFEFAADNDYTFPIYHDSEYSASIVYGVQSIPMTLFISASGELVNYQIGMMNKAMLENYIEGIAE